MADLGLIARFLQDPQARQQLGDNARSALAGLLRGATTDIAGAPADLLSLFKYNALMGGTPAYVPGNSEQLGNAAEKLGLLSPVEDNTSYRAARLLSPFALAGAPKAAAVTRNALGAALSDLAAHSGPANQLGMVTFHGTPHRFAPTDTNPLGAFDLSKIGTGEGAQAYGHGIYIAENPGVAGGYRNVLSDTLEASGEFTPLEKRAGQMALTFGDNTPEGAIKWLSKFEGKGAAHTSPAMTPELIQSVKRKFEDGSFRQGGALYHVDLPDEHIANMLDWDKPLSEQPEAVRYVLQDLEMPKNATGKDVYNSLMYQMRDAEIARGNHGANAPELASRELSSMGIPGIRYLDAGSRGAGEGTRNFVVFDPSILKILKRE